MTNSVQDLLVARYYRNDEDSWGDICARVAVHLWPGRAPEGQRANKAFDIFLNREFIPSSPVLMNAGSPFPMMCSCFVLPVEDSIPSIMKSLTDTVMIQKYGGGVGLNFSAIRPEGSKVLTTGGRASGPVSFMGFWNEAMNVIRQGGKRQGAMMGVLDWDHPDIDLFLQAKEVEGKLTNFNLSVALDSMFFTRLHSGHMDASELLRKIAQRAWSNGEPGVLFEDNINMHRPYGDLEIRATNPCGEVPLPPYGACCLGSINLNAVLSESPRGWGVDHEHLYELVRFGVECLNRVIDTSRWPTPETREFMLQWRPIGLGVMGLADYLAKLGFGYGTPEGRMVASDLMREIRGIAEQCSHSDNTTLLSMAPTGSIAMMAGASYGIEPYFNLSGTKTVETGSFDTATQVLAEVLAKRGYCLTADDYRLLGQTGSVQGTSLPEDIKEIFRTANEIPYMDHLRMQAAIQEYVDNSVSKTINLPGETTVEEIEQIILSAHALGLKGLTVYRDKSRDLEVFTAGCPAGTCSL